MEKLLIRDKYKELNSNRLQLLKPSIDDSTFYRKALSHDTIWKFISEFEICEMQIQGKIEKYTTAIESNIGMLWNIYFQNNPVGILSLHNWDNYNKKAEIGYWILPEFGNKGIISEAIKTTTSFVFNQNLLNRVEAVIYEDNLASTNLIIKNGFTKEALLRDFLNIRGVFTNVYLYSLLKKEWEQ